MGSPKLKIALLIPSLNVGGMERVMSELANYFSINDRTEVHLLLFGKSPELFYRISSNVIIHKIDSGFNKNLRMLESAKRLAYVRRTIREIKPDAVLSFGTQWNNFVLLALLKTSYPVYVSDRGSPVRKYKKSQELFRTLLYPRSAGIIVQTDKAHKIISKRFPKSKVVSIGNPIRNINNSSGIERENIILSVGRLINSKHHDRLIRIFKKISHKGWKLVIVGGDAIKENNFNKLSHLITDLGLEGKVILTGDQKNVEEYYLKSKIFAFTSSIEGFPNVVGEALSAGLPVIAYDCIAGPSEMIADGENGYLVPVFDDSMFQKKLQTLMSDEALIRSMGDKAKKSIQKFSIDTIGKQFLNFILDENTSD
jgi:GalNAc-alpha-(1->4)-GalNAc-alpha-(1->3)-diNAcBac-PP-undecaprenol alpha-1,4-N-acetyl-D-galactosaminyltransferase